MLLFQRVRLPTTLCRVSRNLTRQDFKFFFRDLLSFPKNDSRKINFLRWASSGYFWTINQACYLTATTSSDLGLTESINFL